MSFDNHWWGLCLPERITTGWGGRAIDGGVNGFSLLWDRQSAKGDMGIRKDIADKLNGGAMKAAMDVWAHLYKEGEVSQSEFEEVTLYEDPTFIVRGNSNASHGYVYVAAWFKE